MTKIQKTLIYAGIGTAISFFNAVIAVWQTLPPEASLSDTPQIPVAIAALVAVVSGLTTVAALFTDKG